MKRLLAAVALFCCASILFVGLVLSRASGAQQGPETADVILRTSHGDVALVLYPDVAPLTVERFLNCVRKGVYDGTTFHMANDVMVYGRIMLPDGSEKAAYAGAPTPSEVHDGLLHERGVVGVVTYGASEEWRYQSHEFYICRAPVPEADGVLTIFGRVVYGMEIIDQISESAGGDMVPALAVTIDSVKIP